MSVIEQSNQSKKSQFLRRAFLIALNGLQGVGPKTSLRILAACRQHQLSPEQFMVNRRGIWQEMSLAEETVLSIQKFNSEHTLLDNLAEIEASGLQILTFEDSAYPPLLRESEDFPTVLFVKSKCRVGDETWQKTFTDTLSVVGTRKITGYGRLVLRQFLPALVAAGKTIVSGFMYGVDLEAARLTVEKGGRTVAALGFGLRHCFPESQRQLMADFYEAGAIFLSEFAPAVPPLATNFVWRNRIVAALSPATLVVEAASRSGSHITAAYANDYGRLVMAVPGPITNPFSEGTKDLIRQGATMVNSAADILQVLNEDYHRVATEVPTSQNPLEKRILELFANQAELSLEELRQQSQLTATQLNQLLFNLELQAKIDKKFGKYRLLG